MNNYHLYKRVGFVCGAFDLLHPGQLVMLYEAKKDCDWLIVGLHNDPSEENPYKNKPVETLFERYTRLCFCKYVDEIIPYSNTTDLLNMLHVLPIKIRFLDETYYQRTHDIVGYDVCKKRNIQFYFVNRNHNYSSSNLRKRMPLKD